MAQASCLSDSAEERLTVEDPLLYRFEVSRSSLMAMKSPEKKPTSSERHWLSPFGISRIDFGCSVPRSALPTIHPLRSTMKALFIEQTEGPPGKVLFPLSNSILTTVGLLPSAL